MTFHQGPQGLKIELVYGPHGLCVLLQDPILFLVDATRRIPQRVFQDNTIEIEPLHV
jgi:hypothetical protein